MGLRSLLEKIPSQQLHLQCSAITSDTPTSNMWTALILPLLASLALPASALPEPPTRVVAARQSVVTPPPMPANQSSTDRSRDRTKIQQVCGRVHSQEEPHRSVRVHLLDLHRACPRASPHRKSDDLTSVLESQPLGRRRAKCRLGRPRSPLANHPDNAIENSLHRPPGLAELQRQRNRHCCRQVQVGGGLHCGTRKSIYNVSLSPLP